VGGLLRCTYYAFIYADSRCTSTTNTTYVGDFFNWRSAINTSLAQNGLSTKYMGIAAASLKFLENTTFWSAKQVPAGYLSAFEDQEGSAGANSISIISQHFYDIHKGIQGSSFTADYLFTDNAYTFYDDSSPAGYHDVIPTITAAATTVHQNAGQTFRLGEMNSVDGGGLQGVSDTFASAIWSIDTMFEFAKDGVDGVNWHTASSGPQFGGPYYNLFTISANSSNPYALDSVNPIYYGLYFFHQATPAGAKLLTTTTNGNSGTSVNNKAWATVDSSGNIYVVLLNKSTSFSGNVSIYLLGYGSATVYPLTDPNGYTGSLTLTSGRFAVTGITFAGQTFDNSNDGTIQGTQSAQTISAVNGVYTVSVNQQTMAVLLKIAHL